jgi:hypothetical protein
VTQVWSNHFVQATAVFAILSDLSRVPAAPEFFRWIK